ncbi:hypothetical protein P168DRAFT_280727 [Aspergillus campestris IBT 28561]|uniref:Uncharacterized protein n=1 Tax=Aspergillus campestris (strain IBT 28561) TaxID=1392248 RepID=A0A2I1D7K9_ASPC2|nr:uncharacterized protein P168DRAFT_280727 [Aspergillus campestris IBT 28561]PKY05854.1 hypothetical protein P168DRAFT_280727 [Aspergillus campestris IBT 28561]
MAAHPEPFNWPEICSQHERVLSSHVDVLKSLRESVTWDDDAVRLVASMVERTTRLMAQFQVVKKQLAQKNSNGRDPDPSASIDSRNPRDNHPKERKKRSRSRMAMGELTPPSITPEQPQTLALRPPKRKRLDVAVPGGDEDVRNVMPVSAETEDISEEVQRRLAIKDEKRKKRDSQLEKRKRESLASNGSTSSVGATTKPKKRRRVVKPDAESPTGSPSHVKRGDLHDETDDNGPDGRGRVKRHKHSL